MVVPPSVTMLVIVVPACTPVALFGIEAFVSEEALATVPEFIALDTETAVCTSVSVVCCEGNSRRETSLNGCNRVGHVLRRC